MDPGGLCGFQTPSIPWILNIPMGPGELTGLHTRRILMDPKSSYWSWWVARPPNPKYSYGSQLFFWVLAGCPFSKPKASYGY